MRSRAECQRTSLRELENPPRHLTKEKTNMKQIVQMFKLRKPLKYSLLFEPATLDATTPPIAASIYVEKGVVPPGTTEVKITLSIPSGGRDEEYNQLGS